MALIRSRLIFDGRAGRLPPPVIVSIKRIEKEPANADVTG
jgi:hypothetical protein